MLNEWQDRDPAPRRRPYVLSGGFWTGVTATILALAMLNGWVRL